MSGVESMIDKEKKYTTRDGREVRIYATDGGSDYPVHGAIKRSDGTWEVAEWTDDGVYFEGENSRTDLVEAKPRITGWVNIYADECSMIHSSREDADAIAHSKRIACIEIDVPHGHGLEVQRHGEAK